MTSADIDTPNLGFNGTKLRIFDKIGFNSGENWAINAFGGCFVEVDPSPVSQDIIGIINADIEAGNLSKIDHISLRPTHILGMYLEGVLPIHCIVNAEDHESFLVFKDVPFETSEGLLSFSVWVSVEYEMATIDVNGDIV